MPLKIIITILKIAVTVLYYFLIIVMVILIGTTAMTLFNEDAKFTEGNNMNTYYYDVQGFENSNKKKSYAYSTDSVVRYNMVQDRFTIQVAPNTNMGYYAVTKKFIFLMLGIFILWTFKKIFAEINLNKPFNIRIASWLKLLAFLFIISDVLKLVDYFLFNSILRQSLAAPKFELITETGDGLVTGLIVLIIAFVYQRGIDLQEENALTV